MKLTDGAGNSIFKDRNGRDCIFDATAPANETCVFANYNSLLYSRTDINENRELATKIENHHPRKILPTQGDEGAGGYAGEGSIVATKSNRKDQNDKLRGEIKATPNLDAMRDKLYGWEGHWQPGGTAYNAVANRCFEMLRNAAMSQDQLIPGATPDTSTLIAPEADSDQNRTITFATQLAGLSVIDSLNVSTKVGDGAGGALEIDPGEAGEFLTIDGKKVFRFKEIFRNKMRPLASKLVVLGEAGKDGYDAPFTRAHLPISANDKEIQAQYEALAGPAGVPGFAFNFPKSERQLVAGAANILLKDLNATTAIQEIDKHLLDTYGVTVVRDEKGIPSALEYFPLTAELKRGNEVNFEYSISQLQAQAKASFDVYSRVTGSLALDSIPNLEIQPYTPNPGIGNVNGIGVAGRVGVSNGSLSPLSGFWGFSRGQQPQLFRLLGIDLKPGEAKSGNKPIRDFSYKQNDGGTEAAQTLPISQRFYAETVSLDCKSAGLFGNNNVEYANKPLDMNLYAWNAVVQKHFLIDDENYPRCGEINGKFILPKHCKMHERVTKEDGGIVKENGKEFQSYPTTFAFYQDSLRDACLRSPDLAKAALADLKEELSKRFVDRCRQSSECKQALDTWGMIIERIEQKSDSFIGNLAQSNKFSPENIQTVKQQLGFLQGARNGIVKLAQEVSVNGVMPKVFDYETIEKFDNALNDFSSVISAMEKAARPGVKDNVMPVCSFEISNGRFRKYGKSQIVSSLTTFATQAKIINQRTILAGDYKYPKNGEKVNDTVQAPDVSPLFQGEKLVLQDELTVKPGNANGLQRGVLQDCADLANVLRKEKIPLPRKMFASDMCKNTQEMFKGN